VLRLTFALATTLATCGCAGFWDDLTNRNNTWTGVFVKPDPLQVLASSSDGAKRGQALGALREPLQHGGSQADQEKYLEFLSTAALHDNEPLCRLGAIRALGKYKDPRAAKILEDVYLQRLPFTPELNTIIRQQSLASLEQTGNAEARHLLIRVARQPGAAPEGAFADRQQTLDERLTAIRALSRYKQYDSCEALVYVLETEKDVALRDRAHESLESITGKDMPKEAKAWRDFFSQKDATARQPGLLDRLFTSSSKDLQARNDDAETKSVAKR
jgi:HEAT repeat protein